jgi:ferrous iron transport protein A
LCLNFEVLGETADSRSGMTERKAKAAINRDTTGNRVALQLRLNWSYTEVRLKWSEFHEFCRFGRLSSLPARKSGVRRLRVLSELEVGESGVLVALDLPPGVQNHLMYMGFVPEARVKAVHRAPAGDPTVYAVDGIEIALRKETARAIRVEPTRVEIEPVQQTVTEASPQWPLSQKRIEAVR